MRFLADIVSSTKIAVWMLHDNDVQDLNDGVYEVVGFLARPVLPDPTFMLLCQRPIAPESHFQPQNYNANPGLRPPFRWFCKPHIRGCYARNALFDAILGGYDLTRPYFLSALQQQTIQNEVERTFR